MRTREQWRHLAADCKWTARSYDRLAKKDREEAVGNAGLLALAAFNPAMSGYYKGRAQAYKEIAEELKP